MKANSTKRKIFDAVDLLTEDTSSDAGKDYEGWSNDA